MSDRDKKVLLAAGIIILFVLMICFVRPVLTAQFEDYMETEEAKQIGSIEGQGEAKQSGSIEGKEEANQEKNKPEKTKSDGGKPDKSGANVSDYRFRSRKLLLDHYEKHGIEMGFDSAKDYEKAAAAVVQNPDALHKIEAEDGDDVYYLMATNEFVVVSTDGFIRTYFKPNSGIKYFNRQ